MLEEAAVVVIIMVLILLADMEVEILQELEDRLEDIREELEEHRHLEVQSQLTMKVRWERLDMEATID